MLLSQLASKDVINDHDGTKLGRISDVEIDISDGQILNAIIDGHFKFSNLLGKKEQTTVAWRKIMKIGQDVIIIEKEQKIAKSETKKLAKVLVDEENE